MGGARRGGFREVVWEGGKCVGKVVGGKVKGTVVECVCVCLASFFFKKKKNMD